MKDLIYGDELNPENSKDIENINTSTNETNKDLTSNSTECIEEANTHNACCCEHHAEIVEENNELEVIKPKRNKLNLFLIVGGIIVVGLFIFVLYPKHIKTQTPHDTVAKFQQTLNKIDIKQMTEVFDLTDDEIKELYKNYNEINLAEIPEFAKIIMKKISLKLNDLKYTDDKNATGVIELNFGNELLDSFAKYSNKNIKVNFIKKGRRWYIKKDSLNPIGSFWKNLNTITY